MPPRVSVLLAVRDGLPYLPDAVTSVLEGQTLRDLELVAVDDGSTDGSLAYLRGLTAPRLVVVVVRRPRGLTRALNVGIEVCRAPLVARLDADDVADADRLSRQAAYLDARPAVGLLGTGAYEYGPSIAGYRRVVPPTDDAGLRRALGARNPFLHSSVMFRAAIVRALGGYDERFRVAQDYDLWLRMARVTRLACLPDPLVIRLRHGTSVTARHPWARRWAEARARYRAVRAGQYPPTVLVPRLAC